MLCLHTFVNIHVVSELQWNAGCALGKRAFAAFGETKSDSSVAFSI